MGAVYLPPVMARTPERGITLYGQAGARLRAMISAGHHLALGGGIDIIGLTDSLGLTATDTADQWVDNCLNYFRAYVQEKMNPTRNAWPLMGGYGYLPYIDDGSTRGIAIWGGDNGTFDNITGTGGTDVLQKRNTDSGYDGLSGKVYAIQSGSGKGFWHYFYRENPSGSFRYGLYNHPTSVQVVYQTKASGGTLQIDAGAFAAITAHTRPYTPGSQTLKQTIATAGTASYGNRSSLFTGDPFWWQLLNTGSGEIRLDGTIHYYGDECQGIRVHHLGRGGAVATDYSDATRAAARASFMAGNRVTSAPSAGVNSGNYSQNCGLRIYLFDTNENGTGGSPTVSAAQFKTNLLALTALDEANPQPGDGIIVHAEPRNDSNALGRCGDYEAACRDVAQTRGYAFVNLWDMANYDSWSGFLTTNSYAGSDNTHRTAAWHRYVGRILYRTFMYMAYGG